MNTEAQALIDGFGMNIDASRKVATLSIAQQQMVEIVKAISAKAKIVVMDEPTSSLTDTEVEHLFALIKQLKAQNIGIIYISHKLEELFRICDRITVMRDGERVGTVSTEKTNRNELIKMMVGRTLDEYYIHTERPLGDRVLEAKHIRGKSVKDGSFFLRKGEILGFAGLIGSGRSELMKSMIGIEKRTGGEVYVGGKPVMLNGISDALKVGVALVPEDRKKEGLVLKNSVGFNLTLAVLGEFIRGIHVDRSKEEKIIDQYVDAMSIKASSSRQRVGNLSGGNQQKVLIGKWLASHPQILILDEPTRGVDVGAKAEIYAIINDGSCTTLWAQYSASPAGCAASTCGHSDAGRNRGHRTRSRDGQIGKLQIGPKVGKTGSESQSASCTSRLWRRAPSFRLSPLWAVWISAYRNRKPYLRI